MKDWKQKNKRAEKKGLIIRKEVGQHIQVNIQPNLINTFAGFPRVKGSWNNLWRWDTLEDITL